MAFLIFWIERAHYVSKDYGRRARSSSFRQVPPSFVFHYSVYSCAITDIAGPTNFLSSTKKYVYRKLIRIISYGQILPLPYIKPATSALTTKLSLQVG